MVGREPQRVDAPDQKAVNTREQLLALWEKYSAGLPSASLELRVAQRALRDGCSAKEVALMLVAGSETVRLIHDKQGRKEAIAFASHITKLASAARSGELEKVSQQKGLALEIGD
jgi:hypothetical protein